jgi:hypothetical protein
MLAFHAFITLLPYYFSPFHAMHASSPLRRRRFYRFRRRHYAIISLTFFDAIFAFRHY